MLKELRFLEGLKVLYMVQMQLEEQLDISQTNQIQVQPMESLELDMETKLKQVILKQALKLCTTYL